MEVELEDGFLVIRIPVKDPPVPSSSGKSLVVATSNGNKETELEIDGKKLVIGLNAYLRK